MATEAQDYVVEMQDGETIEVENMVMAQKFGFLEFRSAEENFNYNTPTFGIRADLVRTWSVKEKKVTPPKVTRTTIRRTRR